MKKGFTLIELLVVMIIITVVMGLVAPKGSKMLDGFTKTTKKIQEEHNLSMQRSFAFIGSQEKNITVLDTHYDISSKGVLSEKSDANY